MQLFINWWVFSPFFYSHNYEHIQTIFQLYKYGLHLWHTAHSHGRKTIRLGTPGQKTWLSHSIRCGQKTQALCQKLTSSSGPVCLDLQRKCSYLILEQHLPREKKSQTIPLYSLFLHKRMDNSIFHHCEWAWTWSKHWRNRCSDQACDCRHRKSNPDVFGWRLQRSFSGERKSLQAPFLICHRWKEKTYKARIRRMITNE